MPAPTALERPTFGPNRPALRPALRILRRDRLTLQVGTDPERAVAYAVRDPAVIDLVCSLDGRRTIAELAVRHQLPAPLVRQLVGELAAAGIVEDCPAGPAAGCCPAGHAGCGEDHAASGGRARSRRRGVTDGMRRLAPDLAAWDLLEQRSDGGRNECNRRARATVHVIGSGRLGLSIGLLLGAAGIGSISAGDTEPARQFDRGALALAGVDVGRPRADGLRRRLAEIAPTTRLAPASAGAPDLVVVATETTADRDLAAGLSQRGVPHLLVVVSETLAVIGPFVLPGRTACVHCLDMHRCDADPSWPLVLDRLRAGRGAGTGGQVVGGRRRAVQIATEPGVEASDDVLTTLVAAHTVLHSTMFLRGELPPTADATIEFRLPSGLPRRRSWASHPDCGCGRPPGAAAAGATARATAGAGAAAATASRQPPSTATGGARRAAPPRHHTD